MHTIGRDTCIESCHANRGNAPVTGSIKSGVVTAVMRRLQVSTETGVQAAAMAANTKGVALLTAVMRRLQVLTYPCVQGESLLAAVAANTKGVTLVSRVHARSQVLTYPCVQGESLTVVQTSTSRMRTRPRRPRQPTQTRPRKLIIRGMLR